MSTLRVNAIQNTTTTDGGISIDNSGHVTVDGQKLPSAGPLSNRNLVINGAMQVAQRGTSSTSTEFQTVDRFKASTSGGTTTQSQETLSSGDPYDAGFRNFFRITNTTTGTAAADYKVITHFIEAQNMANSGWDYSSAAGKVTISFWARASVGQDYTFYFRTQDGTGQAYSFNFTLAAGVWKKVTHVVPGASAVVFDNDNGRGLQLTWAPWLGSNYINSGHTDEAWAPISATSISNVSTTTWGTTADATFDVTGVQLEVGSVATPFEHRSYGDELARCQRYYQKMSASSTGNYARLLPFGHMASSTVLRCRVPLHPTMRAQPTFTQSGTFSTQPSVGTPGLSLETSSSAGGESVTLIDNTSISGTAGNCISIHANNDDDAFVAFSAEL